MKYSILQEFIKQAVSIDQLIMIPPPPPLDQRVKELDHLKIQYKNRKNPDELQSALDEDMAGLFDSLVMSAGNSSIRDYIKNLYLSIMPVIVYHKDYFSEVRPAVLAAQINMPFESDDLETAQSPSYPSGHTTQAFYIARALSLRYPKLRDDFFNLAEMIAQSRMDRAVHFPSDVSAGKILAKKLFEKDVQGVLDVNI